MSNIRAAGLVLLLSATILASCERKQTVQAGSEGSTATGEYQPRSAPEAGVDVTKTPAEIKGTLRNVDLTNRTMTLRVDNGMDQTFNWDDQTTVLGMSSAVSDSTAMTAAKSRKASDAMKAMTQLSRRAGSDVSVKWKEDNDMKTATSVNVTDLAGLKKVARPRHRSK